MYIHTYIDSRPAIHIIALQIFPAVVLLLIQLQIPERLWIQVYRYTYMHTYIHTKMIYREDLYIGSSFLPLACTVIETSALWFAIARGTAKGPTPAIMSATTVDPRYMYVCMYVCMYV